MQAELGPQGQMKRIAARLHAAAEGFAALPAQLRRLEERLEAASAPRGFPRPPLLTLALGASLTFLLVIFLMR